MESSLAAPATRSMIDQRLAMVVRQRAATGYPGLADRQETAAPPRLVRADRRHDDGREQLLARLRGEFIEMPCLRPTRAEAQRLFGLRADICARVLEQLAAAGDIRVTSGGRYTRIGWDT